MHDITLSARIGAAIVHAASMKGVSPGLLRELTGFDAELAADPDARISLAQERALWDAAAQRSGDALFGLHAATLLKPGAFDVLEYAVRSAPTLRQALERLARYNRIEHDVAVFSVRDRADDTRVTHTFPGPIEAPCRHAVEFTLASVALIASQISAAPVTPRTVELRHAAAGPLDEYARVFGATPRFGAAANAIEWDRALLERPLPATDPALSRVLVRHAEAVLAALPALQAGYAERVQHILLGNLSSGDTTLDSVARRLKLSARSLQRRLAEEGTSFDRVLDALRHELALRYLDDRSLAIAEVAYLLGYSEPSPFHRAVRRWTGRTPIALRERAP